MVHLDDLVGGGRDVNLQLARFVERTVEQSEQTLMSDVGPVLSGVSFEFVSDVVGVVLTIEEDSLLFNVGDFEPGFFENDDNFPFVDFVLFSEMDHLGRS